MLNSFVNAAILEAKPSFSPSLGDLVKIVVRIAIIMLDHLNLCHLQFLKIIKISAIS
jgi:hypothetical protein